jgi:hypothetical protein
MTAKQYALIEIKSGRFPNMRIDEFGGLFWLTATDTETLFNENSFTSREAAEKHRSACIDRAMRFIERAAA